MDIKFLGQLDLYITYLPRAINHIMYPDLRVWQQGGEETGVRSIST